MSKPFSFLLKSAITILLACSAIPVFAQHGGGHGGGGGGFHGGGGGGFHGGGGGGAHSSGGGGARGGSFAPPAAGYGGSRAAAPYASRPGGGYAARPGNSYASRPGGNFAGGNQRYGNSSSAAPSVGGGQWHSFGGSSGARGPSGAQSGFGPSTNSGGFHVFSGNRGTGSTGTVRSFSGQGGEIHENAPVARNVGPRSQSLSTLHNSFNGSFAASSALRANSNLSATSRFAGGSSLAGSRGFSGGINTARSFHQTGGLNRFGRGCWNCGGGFGRWGGWNGNRWWGWGNGWGFGFGWPWVGFGFGFGDPFWFNPWWGAGSAYGYGYAYPNSGVYSYPDSGYYPPDDYSNPPPQEDDSYYPDDQNNTNGNWITPNGPSPSSASNSGILNVPVLIYLKSGAVYTVRDYWMVDGELHFIQINGAQHSVDLAQVDLPRTNTENAKSGVKFIYKSEPSVTAPEPNGNGMPPGANAPSPTQQLNGVSQPEART
jgi:hypothetical protein